MSQRTDMLNLLPKQNLVDKSKVYLLEHITNNFTTVFNYLLQNTTISSQTPVSDKDDWDTFKDNAILPVNSWNGNDAPDSHKFLSNKGALLNLGEAGYQIALDSQCIAFRKIGGSWTYCKPNSYLTKAQITPLKQMLITDLSNELSKKENTDSATSEINSVVASADTQLASKANSSSVSSIENSVTSLNNNINTISSNADTNQSNDSSAIGSLSNNATSLSALGNSNSSNISNNSNNISVANQLITGVSSVEVSDFDSLSTVGSNNSSRAYNNSVFALADINQAEADISNINSSLSNLPSKDDINGVKNSVTGIKNNVNDIDSNLSTLKQEVNANKSPYVMPPMDISDPNNVQKIRDCFSRLDDTNVYSKVHVYSSSMSPSTILFKSLLEDPPITYAFDTPSTNTVDPYYSLDTFSGDLIWSNIGESINGYSNGIGATFIGTIEMDATENDPNNDKSCLVFSVSPNVQLNDDNSITLRVYC